MEVCKDGSKIRGKILLVDDDPEVLRSCSDYLDSTGFSVTSTSCGREALDVLETERFDIILSDLKMPGTDGIYFLEKVRKIDPDVGFVIFTAYPSVSTAVRSMKSLADDYLEKPVMDFNHLDELLRNLLQKVRDRRMPKSEECLLVGKPGNIALIQGFWSSIHPRKFSSFIQKEKTTFMKGYLAAFNSFIQKEIEIWPNLEFILFLRKEGRHIIYDSSHLPVEMQRMPCRRVFDLELMKPQGKQGGKLVVMDTPEEIKKYPRNRRRNRRTILLPVSISRQTGSLWIQCSPETSVDIRLLAFLTEINAFAQWLTIFKDKKAGKKMVPAGLLEENPYKCVEEPHGFKGFIGTSPPMKEVYGYIKKIAPIDATVLITGETGTGKEVAAQTIHQLGSRRDKPFVAVNCASISETLIESELFGHEKGAFTGADEERIGLFESVDGGTIFFDEIGEISPMTQAKLLRALQEKEIRRVGNNRPRKVDVRIIASTNKNLLDEVCEQRFRKDLFYRLNVASLHLPPLRDRGDDVRLLIEQFMLIYKKKYCKDGLSLAPALWETVFKYPWPGNVRELTNAVEKAVIMAGNGTLTGLPLGILLDDSKYKARMALKNNQFKEAKQCWLEQFEKEFFAERIKAHQGSVVATARDVGMDPKSVWRKVRRYGIITF